MMTGLYISFTEKEALKNIDFDELELTVRGCVRNVTSNELHRFNLENCGPYISNHLRDFQKSIDSHNRAKSSKKRDETDFLMRRAADDLTYAVQQMQQRMKKEEEESRLFQVNDHILQPFHFSDRLEVQLRYQWRKDATDDWKYDTITFFYTPNLSPDYRFPLPKRKPSASKLAQERQEKLRHEWEHLKLLSLHSLRDFFRDGGEGSNIPKTYNVTLDTHTRGLNNFSTAFWRPRPS